MKKAKKIIKLLFYGLLILFVGLYIIFVQFTAPKSDAAILKKYKKSDIQPVITKEKFNDFEYRKITIQKDTTLPTIVFVHGTVGSINDFSKYLSDTDLQQKANMVSYDRIGYNYKDKNPVQESIAFECAHLQEVINSISSDQIIVFGYSYGGPIALSIKQKVKHIVLAAPAVCSKVEPMPWVVNLYKFKGTRWMISRVWQQASKEKISHPKDLKNFENDWKNTPNKILSIHGTKDWIAPITNSVFLQNEFLKSQFKLVTIEGAGHELIWSEFEIIKELLLKVVD